MKRDKESSNDVIVVAETSQTDQDYDAEELANQNEEEEADEAFVFALLNLMSALIKSHREEILPYLSQSMHLWQAMLV